MGFKLRIRGQKERIVSGFKSAGYKVAAVGDSLNDLSLLKSCDYPVLYRPVEALAREFPGVWALTCTVLPPLTPRNESLLPVVSSTSCSQVDLDVITGPPRTPST